MRPRAIVCLLAVLAALPAGLSAGPAEADPAAVIELFTSQGCSSCPPADRLMTDWARDPNLVAISMPVDYWDYLGWRDTLAQHDFTLRQQAYAHLRGDRDVYTPQVVVNGSAHVVGSKKGMIEAAIRAHPDGLPVRVGIANSPGGFIVSAQGGTGQGDIVLVPIKRASRVAIERGENSGSTMTYANVARGLRKIGTYEGRPITLTIGQKDAFASGADAFAILVQRVDQGGPGPIIGAAMMGGETH